MNVFEKLLQSAALLSEIGYSIYEPSRTLRHTELFSKSACTTNYFKTFSFKSNEALL